MDTERIQWGNSEDTVGMQAIQLGGGRGSIKNIPFFSRSSLELCYYMKVSENNDLNRPGALLYTVVVIFSHLVSPD